MNGRPVYCNGGRTQWLILKRSQKRDHVVGHAAKEKYPSLAEEKHFTVYSKRSNMFTTTKVNRVLSEIHVSSFQCSFIHIHSNFVLSPDFWCGKKLTVGCFFCQKRWWFKATGSAAACGFSLFGHHLRQSSSPFHGRWCLGTLDYCWWQSNPINPLGCISETFTKPLQIKGSLTWLSTAAGFLSVLNLQHHTSPLLDFPYITDRSISNQPDVMSRWSRKVQAVKKEPTFEA